MKDTSTFMVARDAKSSDFSGIQAVSCGTTDGGQTWEIGVPGMTAAATHYIPNSDSAFIMVGHVDYGWGSEGTAITYDYGNTWEQLDNTSIVALDFIDKNTGIGACCNNSWPTANGQVHIWDFQLMPTPVVESLIPASISLSPNPTANILTVQTKEPGNAPFYSVEIYAADGQKMFSKKQAPSNQFDLAVGFLPKGIYSLKIIYEEKYIVEQFIKN